MLLYSLGLKLLCSIKILSSKGSFVIAFIVLIIPLKYSTIIYYSSDSKYANLK